MRQKYVRHSHLGFVIFPDTALLHHIHVGELLLKQCRGTLLSAGFCFLGDREDVLCFGRSESLDLDSRRDDTEALKRQLFGGTK